MHGQQNIKIRMERPNSGSGYGQDAVLDVHDNTLPVRITCAHFPNCSSTYKHLKTDFSPCS